MDSIILGSQERYTISMKPHNGSSLSDLNWQIKVKAAREVTVLKEEAHRIDDDTYEFVIDTSKVGTGMIGIRIYIYLRDELVEGGERLVIKKFVPGDLVTR